MKIDHVKIYDLEECIVASGLPMLSAYDEAEFAENVAQLKTDYAQNQRNKHLTRACKLAASPSASGHGNFLKGILVACNVTGTQAWWIQAGRYGHFVIDSSMSKMHRLKSMNFATSCHPKTSEISRQEVAKCVALDDIESLVYACPMGLELTARVNTNYMQLRIIYHQRKAHRLSEWHSFCHWIESLPLAREFMTNSSDED
ncbi:MAG: hypothetical protein LBB11_03820 [Puniceicoccales bacterium]|jgi:hypothetical protein|nr:hypothetical protein [Puniceicoccales bacterium]